MIAVEVTGDRIAVTAPFAYTDRDDDLLLEAPEL